MQEIQIGIREEEAHKDARLMAALERAAKALGIEVTQQELQQSAAMFEPLLRQELARADLMEFEAQKAPEQYELSTQKLLQEIQNLAAQGQLTSLQAQLLSQALPDLLRQEAAKAGTMEAEARRAQIEADLLAEFGRQREQMALRAAEVGIALDEATLDRLLRTTDAVVAKAVAEASLAQTEAQTQEALAPIVIEQAKAELENLHLQNQIDSAEYDAMLKLLPIQVEQALENLQTLRVRRQSEELQLELAREFDRRFKIESLKSLELNNLRQAVGLELDQAELERYVRLTDPIVQKAVAEAAAADIDALFKQSTFDTMVAKVEAELQAQLIANKISEQEYEVAQQLIPYRVQQALETVKSIQLQNEAAEWQLQLSKAFDEKYMSEGLKKLELENLRQAVGLELDQAELERYVRLTDPIVQKAVAEAAAADIDALFRQDTFATMVAKVEAELQAQLIANKISEQEYDVALKIAPYRVQQAAEEVLKIQLQNEAAKWQLQLSKAFDEKYMSEGLKKLELENLRQAVGLQMDQAELERFVKLTDPIVQKAVAEAAAADIEALFKQSTFDTMVAQVEAELQAQLIANKINEHEYELALKIAPYRVQEALETVKSIQLQNEAAEWQLQLSKAFDEKYMIEGLKKLELENLRQAVGLQMDQAELERFVKLTDPIVQKAVAEAAVADIEALFKQSTFETMVAKVEAELQAQLIANKISEQEYELAQQLIPYRVQQAAEELLSLQLQNEARELENQYARDTLPQRIQLVSAQLRNLELEQQQTELKISELRRQIAMAQRTEPLLVAQLEAELENTKLRNQQLAIQIAQLEQQAATYQGLDADDRDFAFKLYQAENELFRGQNVWIPPFADYVANMMSENRLDWNIYVTLYDEEMRQSIGPPPEGDALDFPWMSQAWQNLYKKELDGYIATLPDSQWRLRQAPLFPSMAVFYGNYMSENPMDPDELIQRYNDGTIPQYIYDIAFGRPVSGTGTSKGRMDELISDLPNIFPSLSSLEDILSFLQSGHPAIQSLMEKIEEIYGVTGDELIAELRRR